MTYELHNRDPGDGSTTLYSGDSSYFRFKQVVPGEREIEFPDGTIHNFQQQFPTDEWRLTEIRDRHGNFLEITYDDDPPGGGQVWTLRKTSRSATETPGTSPRSPPRDR